MLGLADSGRKYIFTVKINCHCIQHYYINSPPVKHNGHTYFLL